MDLYNRLQRWDLVNTPKYLHHWSLSVGWLWLVDELPLIIDLKEETFWNDNRYIDQLLSGIEILIAVVIHWMYLKAGLCLGGFLNTRVGFILLIRLNCRPLLPLGTGSGGGIPLKSGGGAQGQRKGDRPAGGGRPETAGQPDQTPRDHQLPDHTAGAAAQQQDRHSQGTNRTHSCSVCCFVFFQGFKLFSTILAIISFYLFLIRLFLSSCLSPALLCVLITPVTIFTRFLALFSYLELSHWNKYMTHKDQRIAFIISFIFMSFHLFVIYRNWRRNCRNKLTMRRWRRSWGEEHAQRSVRVCASVSSTDLFIPCVWCL